MLLCSSRRVLSAIMLVLLCGQSILAADTVEQVLAARDAEIAKATERANQSALFRLRRMLATAKDAEKVEIYKAMLRMDRNEPDAVKFFTALGMLEKVLQDIEASKDSAQGNTGVMAPAQQDSGGQAEGAVAVSYDGDLEIASLAKDERYALNRDYTVTSIPKEFEGLQFVRLKGKDAKPIEYHVPARTVAYLLIDKDVTPLVTAATKDGWKEAGRIPTSDGRMRYFLVFMKPFHKEEKVSFEAQPWLPPYIAAKKLERAQGK